MKFFTTFIAALAIALTVTNVYAEGPFTTRDGWIAAFNTGTLDAVTELVIDGDKAALGSLLDQGLIFKLKPGLEVFVIDRHGWLSRYVKIRLRGTMLQCWTFEEAIK